MVTPDDRGPDTARAHEGNDERHGTHDERTSERDERPGSRLRGAMIRALVGPGNPSAHGPASVGTALPPRAERRRAGLRGQGGLYQPRKTPRSRGSLTPPDPR